jgi:rare lipoprotein A
MVRPKTIRRFLPPAACFFCLWTAASTQVIKGQSESGMASWYGAPYDGRPSASGEIYDQEQLTAAHRTLPFGTRVRVRRLDRDSSVIVRINDRGPFVKSRIIDLSHKAAVQLGMGDRGMVPVTVEVVEMPPVAPRHNCSVGLTLLRSYDGSSVVHVAISSVVR